MGVVDVDPLAVLPNHRRISECGLRSSHRPWSSPDERREQLRSLRSTLASVRRQLDHSEQAAARLTAELDAPRSWQRCSASEAVCRRCVGATLSVFEDVGRCPRCEWTVPLEAGRFACGELSTVVLRDATGTEQALCLSHAAAAIRRTPHLAVVSAFRPVRAVLGEVAGESCVVRRHVGLLVDAQGGPRGG